MNTFYIFSDLISENTKSRSYNMKIIENLTEIRNWERIFFKKGSGLRLGIFMSKKDSFGVRFYLSKKPGLRGFGSDISKDLATTWWNWVQNPDN